MSQLDPEQIAAYDQIKAHFDPRIELTVTALQVSFASGISEEDAYAQSVRAFYFSLPDREVLASMLALTCIRMAQERNAREVQDV